MDRQEFMKELEFLLTEITTEERNEALQYYEDYFEDAGEDKEAKVIEELGSPEKVAKSIQLEMSQGNVFGEFTERGYQSGATGNLYEVLDSKNAKLENDSNNNQDINDNESTVQIVVTGSDKIQRTVKQDSEATNSVSNVNPLQQESYQARNNEMNGNPGNPDNQNHSYRNQDYANQSNHNQGYNNQGNNQNGNNHHRNQNGNYYNGRSQGQENYQNQNNSYYEQPRKKGLSAGAIILLCIFAIPVGLPILCALFGVFVGLAGAVIGLIFGFGAAAVTCIVTGFTVFLIGITKLVVLPFVGILFIGGGLLVFGIGLVFAVLTSAFVRMLPALFRGFISICKAPFKIGGAMA